MARLKLGRITSVALMLAALIVGACAAPKPDIWRPFSDDSPWNTPLPSRAKVDPNSEALMADMGEAGPLYLNKEDWSIPVYFIDSTQTPLHSVKDIKPGIYGKGFGPDARIPIPDGVVPSPPEGGDNHLAIIDKALGLEWGMWWARRDDRGGWMTGLGAVTDLNSDGVAPPWNESAREMDSHRARASGFPLIAGLIRPEEIAAGEINHALVFAYPNVRTEYFVPPASTAQAQFHLTRNSKDGLPVGAHIRLKPTVDVEALELSDPAKIIARALQKYGAFLGDYAGGTVLYLDNSPDALTAWAGVLGNEDLGAVFTGDFIAQNFEVLELGEVRDGQNIGKR